ncbi:MAG: methyltransferase domain-containing protein [candidate division NC10 bacterium]|nr:methyltransferase domain-containing protein [candidate division NC10 bacterium]MDE2322844.1 methyltransferase domain-containing protein [candidate division NC10 bacterium]
MDELQEIDVEQVMDRIRENIRRKRTGEEGFCPSAQQAGINPAPTEQGMGPRPYGTGNGTPPLQTDGQMAADLAALRSGYDVYRVHFTSHRKFLGSFIVIVKKILQKLLNPIFTRQVAYNAANARIAAHLEEEIETIRQHVQLRQELSEQQAKELQAIAEQQAKELQAIAELQAQLREEVPGILSQEIRRLQNEVPTGHAQAFDVVRKRVSGAERKLRRILYLLTDDQAVGKGLMSSRIAEGPTAQVEAKKVPDLSLEPDFDYFAFEDRFRGSEADVKERQRNYIEYFLGKGDVLDIGCGRGEFLELLQEAGIKAKGVDLDLDMALHCQDKGLDVIRMDAFSHLESLADESLGGIFAAQVIEHLESGQIIHLVKLCHRKLKPGGILVLETLNPESLFVHFKWFWMDLTHIRLIHPEMLKFLFESVGFDETVSRFLVAPAGPLTIPPLEIRDYPHEALCRFNDATEYLNKLLYGSSDYAVIGKK